MYTYKCMNVRIQVSVMQKTQTIQRSYLFQKETFRDLHEHSQSATTNNNIILQEEVLLHFPMKYIIKMKQDKEAGKAFLTKAFILLT